MQVGRWEAQVSALRQARLSRNWTLDDVVAEVDRRSSSGLTGLTPSLVSSWERGKVRTSSRYRRVLCEVYGLPPDVLFEDQDRSRGGAAAGAVHAGRLRFLSNHAELVGAMIDVVRGARSYLAITGSRSWDELYLKAVEETLRCQPGLVHYRVLFGPPHHPVLAAHLQRLLRLRDPDDRRLGVKTLHIGLVDPVRLPERFVVASEATAVVVIPSLTTAEAFDTGMLLGSIAAEGLVNHVRELYAGATRVESAGSVRALPVLRPVAQRKSSA